MNGTLVELHAREILGMGDDWRWYEMEILPENKPYTTIHIRGAVAPPKSDDMFNIDWDRKDTSTDKEIYISIVDHERWEIEWSKRTGKCAVCVGSGKVFKGWSEPRGTITTPCRACGGSGKPVFFEAPPDAGE